MPPLYCRCRCHDTNCCYSLPRMLGKNSSKETREAWALAAEHSSLADLYHAFHHVHSFTTDPFTDLQPEVLLQVTSVPSSAVRGTACTKPRSCRGQSKYRQRGHALYRRTKLLCNTIVCTGTQKGASWGICLTLL